MDGAGIICIEISIMLFQRKSTQQGDFATFIVYLGDILKFLFLDFRRLNFEDKAGVISCETVEDIEER